MRHSVHGAGVLHPGGLHPKGGLHTGGSAFMGVCLQGGSASGEGLGRPPSDTTGYGKRAGDTHPTEMHSCFNSDF